jgi:hypothetical protein
LVNTGIFMQLLGEDRLKKIYLLRSHSCRYTLTRIRGIYVSRLPGWGRPFVWECSFMPDLSGTDSSIGMTVTATATFRESPKMSVFLAKSDLPQPPGVWGQPDHYPGSRRPYPACLPRRFSRFPRACPRYACRVNCRRSSSRYLSEKGNNAEIRG